MPTRSIVLFVLLLGTGALLISAVSSQQGQALDPGRSLMMAAAGLFAGLGGFKVGRLLASGQLVLGRRLCRSCSARRTTSAAFCETCHRRD